MDVSEFTFRLIVLFLPGLIAFLIVEALTIHRSIPMVRVFLYSLVLGFLCYFIHYPLAKILAGEEPSFSFMDFLKTSKFILEPNEIFVVSGLSVPLALFILYKVPGVYLSTRHGNKVVEFPSLDTGNG